MSKILYQSNQNYSRRLIYMPGNSALKKSKYEIDMDYNPISNGTIQKNSHLCAISVTSLQKSFENQKKIYRKEKLGARMSQGQLQKYDDKKQQSTYQELFNQKQIQKQKLRPKTAQNIKKINIQNKIQKKQQDNQKNIVLEEQLNSYLKLLNQIQSLKTAQNLQTTQFQNQFVEQKNDKDFELIVKDIDEKDNLNTQPDNFEEDLSQNKLSDVFSTSTKIEQIFKQHLDYYNHLSGQCKCFTCTCLQNCQCNFKKMLIKFIPNYKSVYNQNYSNQIKESKNHQNEQHEILVKNCLKNDLLNSNCKVAAQIKSQAGFDYNDHGPQEKTQNYKPNQVIKSFNSQDLTNYKYNFSQNPTYKQVQYKDMNLQPLLSTEPLQKKSLYQENFQQREKKQDTQIMNNALIKRTPYSEVLSFGHNTQNRQTYKGQQVYDKTDLVRQSDHLSTLYSQNQFLKSTNQDYGKIKSLRCE